MCVIVGVTKTESGEVVAENQFITFILGAGGFGGKRTSDKLKVSEPKGHFVKPCISSIFHTKYDQLQLIKLMVIL